MLEENGIIISIVNGKSQYNNNKLIIVLNIYESVRLRVLIHVPTHTRSEFFCSHYTTENNNFLINFNN